MRELELLSPAGSIESLKAAVYNGADAVYLGLGNFNARKKASNFGEEELGKWIDFAHLYGVKVYVALNTLVKNSELDEFFSAVECAAKANADAFIVQSLGNARLIKKIFPGAVLHASTQMGISNRYGAKLCLDEGISRIILSRECSLKDIEDIRGSVNIELEAFVHGALCTSCSGACFMSSFLSCNSGNRGLCLQPCRMRYSAHRDSGFVKEGYLLSLSDLKVGTNVQRLIDAGVSSFKIEGRMRRPEYVAIATSYYRKVLDGKEITQKDEYALEAVYNRGGFTKGYYFGEKNLSSTVHQAHRGTAVGKVIDIYKDTIEVESARKLHKGDGFKLFDCEGRECGSAIFYKEIGGSVYALKFKGNVKKGTLVHITTDSHINDIYLDRKKHLPIDVSFSAKVSQPCVIEVRYNDINIVLISDYVAQRAEKNIIDEEFIQKKLQRPDDIFEAKNIDIALDKDAFVPLSVLTSLKNDAVTALKQSILRKYNKDVEIVPYKPKSHSTMQRRHSTIQKAVISDRAELLNAFKDLALALIYRPDDYSEAQIGNLFNQVDEAARGKLYLYLPYFINSSDLKIIESLLEKYPFKGLYINNVSQILLARKSGLEIFGGVGLNIFNDFDVEFIEDYCGRFTVSQELSEREIKDLAYSKDAFVFSYGEIDSMTLANCPFIAMGSSCDDCGFSEGVYLKDGKGERFYIRRHKISRCYFNIINGRKLCALKDITGNMLFNFTGEDLRPAKAAFDLVRPSGEFTGGHLHRAVK